MNTLEGLREGKITGDVIQLFYHAYDRLGFGYAESVYINALVIELKAAGIPFEREKRVDVWYKGERVGAFRADLVIASKVIVEVKATNVLAEAHRGQLLNYLRCSNLEVGQVVIASLLESQVRAVVRWRPFRRRPTFPPRPGHDARHAHAHS